MRTRVALVALLLALVAAPVGAAGPATTVIFVRHAEKGEGPPQDPPLSEAGRARADLLARMLSAAGVTSVITTQYARTRQTAEAVAARARLEPVVVPVRMDEADPRKVSARYYEEMAEQIRKRRGETIVVVGHSNTIPDIVAALGGKIDPIDERIYDDLFVATLVDGSVVSVARLKFGG